MSNCLSPFNCEYKGTDNVCYKPAQCNYQSIDTLYSDTVGVIQDSQNG